MSRTRKSKKRSPKRTCSPKRTSRRTSSKNRLFHGFSALMILGLLALGYKYISTHIVSPWQISSDKVGINAAISNYSDEVKIAAENYDLPYEYLMALIMLECSGGKPAGARFEPHVFKGLQDVRDGRRSNYENVTKQHLHDASDAALRNLATSWGPFQLMGYKCILLEVNISDIRGSDGVNHGTNWINLTYGDRLRKHEYKNCFHIHNTGTTYPVSGLPKTHDPQYIPRGLASMAQFK